MRGGGRLLVRCKGMNNGDKKMSVRESGRDRDKLEMRNEGMM